MSTLRAILLKNCVERECRGSSKTGEPFVDWNTTSPVTTVDFLLNKLLFHVVQFESPTSSGEI